MRSTPAPLTRGLFAFFTAAALVLMPGLGALTPPPADSAARLNVTSAAGTNKASASGPTTVTVSGSGFQSINKGFGGLYVVFGSVANTVWQPSKGGKADKDFYYVADSQAKDNKGYQRFVAFPGSNTADSANGGVVKADGTFRLSMVIPGPTFTAATSSGGTTTVDCREVQCGIITFGAHGVANGRNEAFQPISFGAAAASSTGGASKENSTGNSGTQNSTATQQPGSGTGNPEDSTAGGTGADGSGTAVPGAEASSAPANGAPREAVAAGEPMLGLEQQTVIAGRSLGFTGRGFAAGEQVVATLSSGLTAAGPITAGQFGEIAGAVQVPADLAAGTHKLKLTGAGSGSSVEAEFSVMADAALLPAADAGTPDGMRWAMIAVIAAAALLFFLVLSSLVTALVRKRKTGPPARSASASRQRPPRRKRRRRPARPRTTHPPVPAVRAAEPEPATSALDRLDESMDKEPA